MTSAWGNLADLEPAAVDVFVVPTLIALPKLIEEGAALGLFAVSPAKVVEVKYYAIQLPDWLRARGARIGFGTDLLGALMVHNSGEFRLRCEAIPVLGILRSATSVNADLLNLSGEIGQMRAGCLTDLLVVVCKPLDDIHLLAGPHAITLLVKDGVNCKNGLQK